MSVNSTFAQMLLFIVGPTLNKNLSYLILPHCDVLVEMYLCKTVLIVTVIVVAVNGDGLPITCTGRTVLWSLPRLLSLSVLLL